MFKVGDKIIIKLQGCIVEDLGDGAYEVSTTYDNLFIIEDEMVLSQINGEG